MIALLLALYPLFPLGSVARRVGLQIPDPFRHVSYRCRNRDGTFLCRGGPYFLFCDPRHDPGVAAAIQRLDAGDFIDVGAHVGFFTVKAARRLQGRGRAIALEPSPRRFPYLKRNVAMNGLENVVCLPYAAADRNGRATLYEPVPTFGPHRRDASLADPGGEHFEVEARTIDSICREFDVRSLALVKIDVEGFEPEVLAGMAETFRQQKPRVVFEALTSESLEQCKAAVRSHGYTVTRIDRGNYLAEPPAPARA